MTTINLHIERLVLDGLPLAAGEGPLVRAAVEAELKRRLGADGAAERFTRSSTIPLVRADAVLRPPSGDDPLGAQIGRAIHGAVGR